MTLEESHDDGTGVLRKKGVGEMSMVLLVTKGYLTLLFNREAGQHQLILADERVTLALKPYSSVQA